MAWHACPRKRQRAKRACRACPGSISNGAKSPAPRADSAHSVAPPAAARAVRGSQKLTSPSCVGVLVVVVVVVVVGVVEEKVVVVAMVVVVVEVEVEVEEEVVVVVEVAPPAR